MDYDHYDIWIFGDDVLGAISISHLELDSMILLISLSFAFDYIYLYTGLVRSAAFSFYARNGAESSGGSGGGGDATPQGIHVWIERRRITHMEKLFQVLGCPDNFKTRLAAFKLEGDALSWWKAHLRTQVGGDAFADTCTWVAFREIFYNRYFPTSEQQRYEVSMGDISDWIQENSGDINGRGFTRVGGVVAAAARNIELLHESGNSNKRDRDGNRIQNRGQGQQENRGRHDQGQHEYRGCQDQNVEHQGRQDRSYDSRRQDFQGQDQRFNGRNRNDRQGQ
ncbi:zinc finger, CCHC-type, retrotransposon gag domain protein, partial [Tanacetum coccineum]